MRNCVNPKNCIHPGTITLLTSGTFDTYHILTAGGKGREQIENALQARAMIISDTLTLWPYLERMAVKRPTSPCDLLRAPLISLTVCQPCFEFNLTTATFNQQGFKTF